MELGIAQEPELSKVFQKLAGESLISFIYDRYRYTKACNSIVEKKNVQLIQLSDYPAS